MRLNDIQARIKETLLDHPDVTTNPPRDVAGLFESGDIAIGERLKVYRNNVVGGLTEIMLVSFPAIEKLVGKEFLTCMARQFILQHPPAQGCLNSYGAGFAEFIESFAPAKSLPYLPDIARLEIALNDAYYAQDDAAIAQDALMKIAPEDLNDTLLYLRDSVQLLQSNYPIHTIRDFAMAEQQDGTVDINSGCAHLMIYRPALETQIIILDETEFTLLSQLADGRTLGDAVSDIMNTYPAFDFAHFLQKHLYLGSFCALGVSP